MLNPQKISPTHEDLFVERYDRLLVWALQLTDRDHERAEDLLHDAFIQFTLARPELGAIQNLDGYFYGMLRNLRLLQARRESRIRLRQLSIVEYDSAEDGLGVVDLRDQLEVQDQLRKVCRYACVRKETSRAACVLILRFFHGYYPSEIALVLQTSRQATDVQLLLARKEAKKNIDEKTVPAGDGAVIEVFPSAFARSTDDFLRELRETIFQSRRGECLSKRQLRGLYEMNGRAAMGSEQLAHIVSCPHCLEEVSQMLGLPPLSERMVTETLGRDKRGRGGSGGSGAGGAARRGAITRLHRRARRVFEHRPQELCVSVNGYVQGAQRINSEMSELILNVNLAEPVECVEVFSEQLVRLLVLNVNDPPPAGPAEQSSLVGLSDGRSLGLTIRFNGPWPTLQVFYRDPTFKEVEALLDSAEEQGFAGLPPPPEHAPHQMDIWPPTREATVPFVSRIRSGIGRLLPLLLRPGVATAVVSTILIAAILFIQLRRPPTAVSAAELLRKAVVAEESIAARPDAVSHRTINLEERRGDCGQIAEKPIADCGLKLVARRRIEIWQSAEKGVTARRLFNEQGRLIAGEWIRSDKATHASGAEAPEGARAVYRSRSERLKPRAGNPESIEEPRLRLRTPNSETLTLEAWQIDPSARDFSALVERVEDARVEERPASYVLNFRRPATETTDGLLSATLTLSRADLHALEQTLVVRQGDELREYRFLEASFERRPMSAVAPAVFDPDPELLSGGATGRHGDGTIISPSGFPGATSPILATAELEVETLSLLNRAGADMGEQVSVTKTREGLLEVRAILETDKRKGEILQALAPVLGNPALKIRIETIAEALRRESRSASTQGSLVAQKVEPADDAIPVDAELRAYFLKRGAPGAQIDEEINRFARRAISDSLQTLQHAWALKRLSGRFSPEELRALQPEAKTKWLGMIRRHAESIRRQSANLRQELGPVFPAEAVESAGEAGVGDGGDLVEMVSRLFELCSAREQAIRSAFATSPARAGASDVKSAQFWRSIKSAESLAAKIQTATP